jgi:hypothetical protein
MPSLREQQIEVHPEMIVPARIMELCQRLTSAGPIRDKLSASEHHEICDFIFELSAAKPLTGADILEIANDGERIPAGRALATYADPSNWVQAYNAVNSDGGALRACEWCFIGPMCPGYELAQNALKSPKQPWDFAGEAA